MIARKRKQRKPPVTGQRCAYPLAAQQFVRELGDSFQFDITQVIGLTNNDAVSKEFRLSLIHI